jgi:predicted amidohydrolase YtcJ
VLKRVQVAAAKAPQGGWIHGEIGLSVLADSRATRTTLDPVSAGHPLLLEAWTGHGIIAIRRHKSAPSRPWARQSAAFGITSVQAMMTAYRCPSVTAGKSSRMATLHGRQRISSPP